MIVKDLQWVGTQMEQSKRKGEEKGNKVGNTEK